MTETLGWAYTRAVTLISPRDAEVLYTGEADGSFLRCFWGTTTRLEWTDAYPVAEPDA
jgi:hypothetical protein